MDVAMEKMAVECLECLVAHLKLIEEESLTKIQKIGYAEFCNRVNLACMSVRFMCFEFKVEFGLDNDSIQFYTKTALELCNDMEQKYKMSNEDLILLKENWFLSKDTIDECVDEDIL